VRRLTTDLNTYDSLTLSADSHTLAAVQTEQRNYLWLAPGNDATRARQLTPGAGKYEVWRRVSWTPDGKILYQSDAGGSASIWIMNADGTSARQLTHEGSNTDPSISPAGRFIVFNSNRFGKQNIWRMDIDGGNPKQLTFGKRNLFPHLSPDERWVVYQSSDAGVSSLWRVPIEGGDPVHLNDTRSNFPVVSPDGKQVACFYWDQANPPHGVMIFPFAGGQPTKRFNIPEPPDAVALDWSLDGRSLLYIDSRLSNIWRQPIDGGEPEQLTNFPGDQVFNFDYSQDGKWIPHPTYEEGEPAMANGAMAKLPFKPLDPSILLEFV